MRADRRISGTLFSSRDIFSPPITRLTVPNAKVLITNTPLSRGGHVFAADGSYVDANLSSAPVELEPDDLDWQKLSGRWSIGIPLRGRGNFSHFLLEGVPNGYCDAIFSQATHCNIVSDSLQDHLFKSFADITSQTVGLFAAPLNAALEVEELRFLRGLKHPINNADERLVEFMRSAADTNRAGSSLERIAVMRRSGRRGITNCEEVLASLRQYDFEVVFPEEHSFPDQVSIFSGAKIVLGIHGAAMSNIIFCQSSATNPVKIIEVAQPTYLTPAFWILADLLSMDYRLIISCGASEELDPRSKFDDLLIPIDVLHAVIKETLSS